MLGAGYDSRAYRFSRSNRSTKVFEVDAAPTQIRKLRCLKAAHITLPESIHYVAMNFRHDSLSNVLEQAGYKDQEKTLFLWEGVSMYLDRESVKHTLDFASHSNSESIIAFDYTIRISEKNMHKYNGASEFIESMQEHHASEELMF